MARASSFGGVGFDSFWSLVLFPRFVIEFFAEVIKADVFDVEPLRFLSEELPPEDELLGFAAVMEIDSSAAEGEEEPLLLLPPNILAKIPPPVLVNERRFSASFPIGNSTADRVE